MEQIKKLLVKKPFLRIAPNARQEVRCKNGLMDAGPEPDLEYIIVYQSDFLREFYPSGHKINDKKWFPDRLRYVRDDEIKEANGGKGAWMVEKVARCAFPFQYVITIKQLAHLAGNKLGFKLAAETPTEDWLNELVNIKQDWIAKNMENALWLAYKSEKITGDAAIAFYMKDGVQHYRVFSYENGDRLYPHYDNEGNLDVFARQYSVLNENGMAIDDVVEVWDKTYGYRFVKSMRTNAQKVKNKVLELFGLDSYEMDGEPVPHGYPCVPIAYKWNRYGPCWSFSQDDIDAYEWSVTIMFENNKSTAFPILTFFGGDCDVKSNATDGRPYAIVSTDPNAKAGILSGEVSDAFLKQLEILLKNIFLGSFTVIPPEVRSGDMPGIAVKLIYSPALEKAMYDVKDWDSFIDDVVFLYKYGYGIEKKNLSKVMQMPIVGYIDPYIHQNTSEVISNLVSLVSTGLLSISSSIEHNPFAMNDEERKILRDKASAAMNEVI